MNACICFRGGRHTRAAPLIVFAGLGFATWLGADVIKSWFSTSRQESILESVSIKLVFSSFQFHLFNFTVLILILQHIQQIFAFSGEKGHGSCVGQQRTSASEAAPLQVQLNIEHGIDAPSHDVQGGPPEDDGRKQICGRSVARR